jgi:hypothetical protein
MDEWIRLELDGSNWRVVIKPKYKKGSYGEMIYVYQVWKLQATLSKTWYFLKYLLDTMDTYR